MRSRRNRRSLKVSHTQTSVPCGTLKYIHVGTETICVPSSMHIHIKHHTGGEGNVSVSVCLCALLKTIYWIESYIYTRWGSTL